MEVLHQVSLTLWHSEEDADLLVEASVVVDHLEEASDLVAHLEDLSDLVEDHVDPSDLLVVAHADPLEDHVDLVEEDHVEACVAVDLDAEDQEALVDAVSARLEVSPARNIVTNKAANPKIDSK